MKTLHLRVNSAIGSRFRACVGAAAYCEHNDTQLVIHWIKETPPIEPFNVPMHDIWTSKHEVVSTYGGPFVKNGDALTGDNEMWCRTCHLSPFLKWIKNPFNHYVDQFKLTEKLQQCVSRYTHRFTTPTVGVIIRHHCKQPSIPEPEWFIDKMKAAVAINRDVAFYVTCDSKAVSEHVCEVFHGRVMSSKLETDYKWSPKIIQLNAADLYIQKETDWVIGSNHSSYCELIALMRGATKIGSSSKPNNVSGGSYEDPWNVPDNAMEAILS